MGEFTHEFFEESSREFMKGKVRHGHMIYYMCSAILKNGKPCSRRAIQDPLCDRVCSQHKVKIERFLLKIFIKTIMRHCEKTLRKMSAFKFMEK